MNNWKVYSGGALLLSGFLWMLPYGDLLQLGNVPSFLIGAGISCLGFLVIWSVKSIDYFWFWGVAVGARFLLLVMDPGDDLWRYLWEGGIQSHGFSPYLYAPSAPELEGFREDWWGKMNNPEVTAIYPPLLQLCLRFITALFGSVWGMKFVFILVDLALCSLLVRRFGRVKGLIYAWNPLVIYSIAGGGHFESLFLLPLVVGWFLWEAVIEGEKAEGVYGETRRLFIAAFAVGISVAIKLISLPVLAWMGWQFLREKKWKQALIISVAGSAPFILSWGLMWLLLGKVGPLMPSEFTLTARGCDFFPWLVGLVWPVSMESNKWVLIVFAVVVLGYVFRIKKLRCFMECFLATFLLMGPSNHAWYFIWLVPFAVSSGNWGTRFLSVSGFVYFWLQQTNALTGVWGQSPYERFLLWTPFLIGWIFFSLQKPKALNVEERGSHA